MRNWREGIVTLGIVILAVVVWPRGDGAPSTPVATATPISQMHREHVLARDTVVFDLALSGDGKRVIAAVADGSVRLWDATSGDEVTSLATATAERPAQAASAVATSPDQNIIATAGQDGSVKLWDVSAGRLDGAFGGGTPVNSLAFSPDGRVLAAAYDDGTIRLWDAATRRGPRTLYGHRFAVRSLAFSSDGALLASSSWDAQVRLWDARRGRPLLTIERESPVARVAFSPDDAVVALAGRRGVTLWEIDGSQPAIELPYTSPIQDVLFSPEGDLLTAGALDGTLTTWEVAGGRKVATVTTTNGPARLALAPGGGGTVRVARAALDDGPVELWAT